MTVEQFLSRLDGVRPRGTGRWSARCPAHADRSPSLSIREVETKILLRCFAGCDTPQIVEGMGLRMGDLFSGISIQPRQGPVCVTKKIDLADAAFQFELAALDRRLRAERICEAERKLDLAALSDTELDRALNAAMQAVADKAR